MVIGFIRQSAIAFRVKRQKKIGQLILRLREIGVFLIRKRSLAQRRADRDFSGLSTDITVLAVYVPGADWEPAALEDQIRLAKRHGISGFAVVLDPSNRRQSERTLDALAAQAETGFSFMAVCVYDRQTAPEQLIAGLARAMKSESYLRIDGKPVIGVDNSADMEEAGPVFEAWRKAARDRGLGEILIWACAKGAGTVSEQSVPEEKTPEGSKPDAYYEFPPRGKDYAASCATRDGGTAHDYGSLIEGARWFANDGEIPIYRGSMLAWDDFKARGQRYDCWIGFSPERFYLWNRINIRFLREHNRPQDRILFVNAWNDREHGTVLEPDREYGCACLNALSKAIFDLPFEDAPEESSLCYLGAGNERMRADQAWHRELDKAPLIAVHAHVFYPDLTEETLRFVSNIPFPFDLYITTDTEEKREEILRYLTQGEDSSLPANVTVSAHPNKGRDIAPFLSALRGVLPRYRYICHIHTKKSAHLGCGNAWRRYLLRNLLGSESLVREILYMFEQEPALGIVFPQNLDLIRKGVGWLKNKALTEALMRRMGFSNRLPRTNTTFPAGDMFWARSDAIRQMFTKGPSLEDFPEENGQLDGTVMHAIERSWCLLARANGYTYRNTRYLADNRPFDLLRI